jgi:hypothetical protein
LPEDLVALISGDASDGCEDVQDVIKPTLLDLVAPGQFGNGVGAGRLRIQLCDD